MILVITPKISVDQVACSVFGQIPFHSRFELILGQALQMAKEGLPTQIDPPKLNSAGGWGVI